MYGGSALRICHDLNRMSIDLDFEIEHPASDDFLKELKKEIETYFKNTYNFDPKLLTIRIKNQRGLLIRFLIGEQLGINHPSNQVHVKIDLNYFSAPKTFMEYHPINHDQLSFVMKIYNIPTLMASKIAAIFLRGQRGVDKMIYEEKGRDIYDLLWYMEKKVTPNLDYLIAKGIDIKDPQALFDKLTLQINKVNDTNLKQDLMPLFINHTFIENWLQNWRKNYLYLLSEYKIHTVKELHKIYIYEDFRAGIFSFAYEYTTKDEKSVKIIYAISDYWIKYREGALSISVDKKIINLIEFNMSRVHSRPASKDKLIQFATLFYQKTENYLKKMNNVTIGEAITTKVIRLTADNLNQKEEILLNKSALLSCTLDDLLK